MTTQEEMIEGIKQHGKQKKGMANLINHLKGKPLTQRQAIHAYCYHCSGYGQEEDCKQVICPLYPYAPYSSLRRAMPAKKKNAVNAPSATHNIHNRISGEE